MTGVALWSPWVGASSPENGSRSARQQPSAKRMALMSSLSTLRPASRLWRDRVDLLAPEWPNRRGLRDGESAEAIMLTGECDIDTFAPPRRG